MVLPELSCVAGIGWLVFIIDCKILYIKKEVNMSDIYYKAHQEYEKARELYLNNKLNPNRLERLRAGKKYFKDNTYDIPENESEDKSIFLIKRT